MIASSVDYERITIMFSFLFYFLFHFYLPINLIKLRPISEKRCDQEAAQNHKMQHIKHDDIKKINNKIPGTAIQI